MLSNTPHHSLSFVEGLFCEEKAAHNYAGSDKRQHVLLFRGGRHCFRVVQSAQKDTASSFVYIDETFPGNGGADQGLTRPFCREIQASGPADRKIPVYL